MSEIKQITVDRFDDIFDITSPGADGVGGRVTGAIEAVAPCCLCTGTLVATERGERPIESLQIGDRIVTMDGSLQPIRWIGCRSYAGSFVAGQHLMLPICVTANAIAPGVPKHDLFISPGHALLVEGHLIPTWRLINDVSIIQAIAVEEVTYINIELHRHNIMLVNGTPAETFLDHDCRNQFTNAAEFYALYPDSAAPIAYAPLLEEGFELQRVQKLIAARANITPPSPHEPGPLRGHIDVLKPGRICGWAQDQHYPDEPVTLTITIGDTKLAPILANRYRGDLRKDGLGNGCHGFDTLVPSKLTGPVTVRRSSDGAILRDGTAGRSEVWLSARGNSHHAGKLVPKPAAMLQQARKEQPNATV